MYHHIRIEYQNRLNEIDTVYSYDITDFSVVKEIIKSILDGNSIMISEISLAPEYIRNFHIFRSNCHIDACVNIKRDRQTPIPGVKIMHAIVRSNILGDREICPNITDELLAQTRIEMANN